MAEWLSKLQNDSTLMFIASIVLAILLIIVLVVVVFSTRAKVLADKLYDMRQIEKEQDDRIAYLERELQAYQIKDAAQTQELAQFAQTKEILKEVTEAKQALESYNFV